MILEPFLTSTAVVALAEIGDKTQLLAIVLATRFKKPWAVVGGILLATLANHFLAALVGEQVAGILDAAWFRYAIAIGFLVMGAWTLVPDKLDDDEGEPRAGRLGPLMATAIAFFLVEMGDKTQIATIALGAQFHAVLPVMAGSTLGMMIANVPAVFMGQAVLKVVPLNVMRVLAALLLIANGIWALAVAAGWL
ncbi:TMEM165/GDT1 family protein [Novosphingobium sp. 9]|uniref:TMEM165/GDT1 family protein n=1 Tax=Novosphingobium sp. 9 TaxID=2025349 RepID=UPI0021B6BF7D|nr:TMEM165/GDT1 family protein [Novosphingobium sp. 9]